MKHNDLKHLIALIAEERHVENVRLTHEDDSKATLMITPSVRDRRSTHRLQGVMRRALSCLEGGDTLVVDHIQRPPVIKKRVYINEKRHNEPRFSHYAHNEWEVTLTEFQDHAPPIHFDPFNPRRHITGQKKAA